MKFYSEKLNKFYETQEECLKAEDYILAQEAKELQKKKELAENRAKRAKEIEESYKALLNARKDYNKKLNDFCRDYGSYHITISDNGKEPLQFYSFL